MPRSDKSGVDTRLHCVNCGTKRSTKLAIQFPKEDGKTGLAFIKIKNLFRMLRDHTLPTQEGAAFPTKGLVGICDVCTTIQYFDIVNNKLVAGDKVDETRNQATVVPSSTVWGIQTHEGELKG